MSLRVQSRHISMRRAHWGALTPSVRDRFIAVLILRRPCVISDREAVLEPPIAKSPRVQSPLALRNDDDRVHQTWTGHRPVLYTLNILRCYSVDCPSVSDARRTPCNKFKSSLVPGISIKRLVLIWPLKGCCRTYWGAHAADTLIWLSHRNVSPGWRQRKTHSDTLSIMDCWYSRRVLLFIVGEAGRGVNKIQAILLASREIIRQASVCNRRVRSVLGLHTHEIPGMQLVLHFSHCVCLNKKLWALCFIKAHAFAITGGNFIMSGVACKSET
jgi:hypothetical protein